MSYYVNHQKYSSLHRLIIFLSKMTWLTRSYCEVPAQNEELAIHWSKEDPGRQIYKPCVTITTSWYLRTVIEMVFKCMWHVNMLEAEVRGK